MSEPTTELQDALKRIPHDWNGGDPIWRDSIMVLRNAARRVANLDKDTVRKFINNYGIYPYDMGEFVDGIVAALGITEEE